MPSTAEAPPVIFRPTEPEDAPAMLALFLDRKADSEPGHPEYTARRAAWFAVHGQERFRQSAINAQRYSQRYFSHVAVAGDELVGLARAEAPPGKEHTLWQGMTVAAVREHLGIGRGLEGIRISWAAKLGRPVVARVAEGNERSFDILSREGFVAVYEYREMPDGPLLRTLVLGELKLEQLVSHPPRLPISAACTSDYMKQYYLDRLREDELV